MKIEIKHNRICLTAENQAENWQIVALSQESDSLGIENIAVVGSLTIMTKIHPPSLECPSVVEQMNMMDDERRMEVISRFCRHCGSKDPSCQCWNDE